MRNNIPYYCITPPAGGIYIRTPCCRSGDNTVMEDNMVLTGDNLKEARKFCNALKKHYSSSETELIMLLAKAQDCATDAINVINTKVTKQMATNNIYISKIVDVLVAKGYGGKIRFMPEPPRQ